MDGVKRRQSLYGFILVCQYAARTILHVRERVLQCCLGRSVKRRHSLAAEGQGRLSERSRRPCRRTRRTYKVDPQEADRRRIVLGARPCAPTKPGGRNPHIECRAAVVTGRLVESPLRSVRKHYDRLFFLRRWESHFSNFSALRQLRTSPASSQPLRAVEMPKGR